MVFGHRRARLVEQVLAIPQQPHARLPRQRHQLAVVTDEVQVHHEVLLRGGGQFREMRVERLHRLGRDVHRQLVGVDVQDVRPLARGRRLDHDVVDPREVDRLDLDGVLALRLVEPFDDAGQRLRARVGALRRRGTSRTSAPSVAPAQRLRRSKVPRSPCPSMPCHIERFIAPPPMRYDARRLRLDGARHQSLHQPLLHDQKATSTGTSASTVAAISCPQSTPTLEM